MTVQTIKVKLSDVVFDETIYPRAKHDPTRVQEYAQNLDTIEAMQNFMAVDSQMRLLDGRHRHLAYLKIQDGKDRDVTVYQYPPDVDSRLVSIRLNSTHGQQLTLEDKRRCCCTLYSIGYTTETICSEMSVNRKSVNDWTKGIREQKKKEQDEKIFDLWMACYTEEEIASVVDVGQSTVHEKSRLLSEMSKTDISDKSLDFKAYSANSLDFHTDTDFTPPLYNIWTFAKKTNNVGHFGNSEQRILDNLLYLYTEPFDIVVDPFAGGGSTIDVCRRRLRRYWASDRKPIVERENEIRKHDLMVDGALPLNRNWSNVSLTYLDPPYWRQAAGQYSDDPTDLANMPLEEFTKSLSDIVNEIAKRQSKGVIALLIQPTQWKSDERMTVDHVVDLIGSVGDKKLVLENRISCPYATEQYNAQQVEWAKEHKKLLVLTRELIVWRLK